MKSNRLEEITAKLIGRPAYILLESEGASFGGEHTGGLYGRRLDMQAREFLQAADRWDGRRVAVYLDDVRVTNDFDLLANLIHEIGHFADMGHDPTPEVEISPAAMVLTRATHARGVEKPVVPVAHDELHSARFVRATIHFWRRFLVQQRGLWCPPDWLWDGSLYGAPSPIEVIRALGDEPERLEKLPVNLILDLPAPQEFNELFSKE